MIFTGIMERKNIITGVVLIALFLMLGAYLESQMGAGVLWKTSPRHGFWKMAHIHGIGFGILNILYAFVFKSYAGQNKITNIGSSLCILGSFLPAGLFLAGIVPELMYMAPVGGLSMVSAWAVLAYSLLTKK